MTVIQRLATIAKPYRGNLYAGLSLIIINVFLETTVITALIAALLSLIHPENDKPDDKSTSPFTAFFNPQQLEHAKQVLKDAETAFLAHFIDPTNIRERLLFYAVTLAIVVFLKCVVAARAHYMMFRFANLMARDMRLRLFKHQVKQPPSYFESSPTGEQLSRITNDVVALQQGLGPDLAQVVQAPLTIFFSLTIMAFISWKLMLTALCLAPLIGLIMSVAGRKIRKIIVRMQERLGDLNGGLIERLSNIRIVQSFVRERYEVERVDNLNQKYYQETMKSVLLTETLSPSVELIAWIGMVIGVVIGGNQVLSGQMSAGAFYMFVLLGQKAGTYFKQLSRVNQLRQQINGTGERIFSTLDVAPDIQDAPTAVPLPLVQGHIVYDNLCFGYRSGGQVLSDIDLTVEPGEVIALVGPSGSGKTTLVNLLPRFYDPTAGRILVDGHDLRDVTLESLREQVGIVPQETMLFSGSIYENILYGKLDATEEEVIEAARSANALVFIERLPDGFRTVVGERGTRLSGGQRQRVAIARALLKNPRILILDEATSALDTESEHLVQQALDRLMLNRTTFVIAHRLSTVKNATRLLVLDHGRIVEAGTHDELLKHGGLYMRLYEMQFRTGATADAVLSE